MPRPANSNTLILIKTPSPVRLWNGFGLFRTPISDRLDPDEHYGPLPGNPGVQPTMGALPKMKQPIGGIAEALDFTFTGVESIPQDWVDNGTANGCALHVGKVFRDADDNILDDGIWWMRKFIIASAQEGGDSNSSVVTLNVESAASYRARANLRMFNDSSHRLDNPTDDFFFRVALNAILRTLVWK